jgi:predicted dehydrogenase
MKTIKVGVIGVGYLGKFHAEKYASMEGVELVGVVDVDKKAAADIAAKFNTQHFTEYTKMLEHVDAVSIVVPTSYHYEVAKVCLEHDVDVLIEKPMTTTLDEADELIRIAEKRDRIVQVGLLERFNPAVLAMAGHVSKPMFIESHRIHTFKNRGVDVDVVLDLMIHDIDIILSLVDSPLKTIHAVGVPVVTNTTDIANARLIFENGCTANVTVSRISKDNIRKLRVFQHRSFVAVDYAKKEILVIKHTDELGENGLPKEEIMQACFIEKDALETELKDFTSNVRNHAKPRVSGKEGRQALAVAMEIMSQIKEHVSKHGAELGL